MRASERAMRRESKPVALATISAVWVARSLLLAAMASGRTPSSRMARALFSTWPRPTGLSGCSGLIWRGRQAPCCMK